MNGASAVKVCGTVVSANHMGVHRSWRQIGTGYKEGINGKESGIVFAGTGIWTDQHKRWEPRLRPFCRCDVSSDDGKNGPHPERPPRHKSECGGKGPKVGTNEFTQSQSRLLGRCSPEGERDLWLWPDAGQRPDRELFHHRGGVDHTASGPHLVISTWSA